MSVINMMQDSCGCFRAEITAVLIEHCAEHDGKKQLLIQYGGVNYDVIALESERDALRNLIAKRFHDPADAVCSSCGGLLDLGRDAVCTVCAAEPEVHLNERNPKC